LQAKTSQLTERELLVLLDHAGELFRAVRLVENRLDLLAVAERASAANDSLDQFVAHDRFRRIEIHRRGLASLAGDLLPNLIDDAGITILERTGRIAQSSEVVDNDIE
jgi:hypothetical protein